MLSEDIKDTLIRAGYKDIKITTLPEVIIVSSPTLIDENTKNKILIVSSRYIKVVFELYVAREENTEIKIKKIPRLLNEWWKKTKEHIEKSKDEPKFDFD